MHLVGRPDFIIVYNNICYSVGNILVYSNDLKI